MPQQAGGNHGERHRDWTRKDTSIKGYPEDLSYRREAEIKMKIPVLALHDAKGMPHTRIEISGKYVLG